MAYIYPDSNIIFCRLPDAIDSTFTNTLTFENRTAQYEYFMQNAVKTVMNYSIVRRTTGQLKVEGSYETYLPCNYMVFQNNNFGNKYFYAFITERSYINPNTTLITFMIDPIQTYFLFDCELKQSMVEREHVADDDDLSNMWIEEDVGVGDYDLLEESVGDFDDAVGDIYIIVGLAPSQAAAQLGGFNKPGFYGGQYVPYYWGMYTLTAQSSIDTLIQYLETNGVVDSIVGMWYYFDGCIPVDETTGDVINTPIIKEEDIEVPFNWSTGSSVHSLNGYIPKNNKLYCYPYTVLELNGYGSKQVLKYEDVDNKIMRFYLPFNYSSSPFIWVKGYNRMGNYLDGGVAGKALPLYSYSYNAAVNTYNQSRNERQMMMVNKQISKGFQETDLTMKSINKILTGINSPGGLEGSGINPITGLASLLNTGYEITKIELNGDLAQTERLLRGKQADNALRSENIENQNVIPELSLMLNWKTPFWCGRTQKRSYLETIDNFFSMYGYKINKIKIPNFKTRPNWNYLKLAVANVTGSCSAEDLKTIKTILENGLTFWHNPSTFGDYTQNNK